MGGMGKMGGREGGREGGSGEEDGRRQRGKIGGYGKQGRRRRTRKERLAPPTLSTKQEGLSPKEQPQLESY